MIVTDRLRSRHSTQSAPAVKYRIQSVTYWRMYNDVPVTNDATKRMGLHPNLSTRDTTYDVAVGECVLQNGTDMFSFIHVKAMIVHGIFVWGTCWKQSVSVRVSDFDGDIKRHRHIAQTAMLPRKGFAPFLEAARLWHASLRPRSYVTDLIMIAIQVNPS